MAQLKDAPIAVTSDKIIKIKEEVECNFPEKKSTSCKDASKDEREFKVTLNNKEDEHLVRGRLSDSLLSVLKSTQNVQEMTEKKKNEEFHLIWKQGSRNAFVNLGMPLKCVSEGSLFKMKSYKLSKKWNTNEVCYRQYDDRKEECVLFYVNGNASRMECHGAQSRRIIKNINLLEDHCSFCIFAPKGESIKDALCNDGRFLPLLKEQDWTLVKDGTIINNRFLVDRLSDQLYDIEVKSKKYARYSGDQNKQKDLDLEEGQLTIIKKPQPQVDFEEGQLSAPDIQQPQSDGEQGQQQQFFQLQFYPKLKKERENIDKFLKASQSRPEGKDIFEVYKRDFGKECNDSLTTKLVRTLGNHADSVGFIEWRSFGSQGSATCFVLHDRYILTCYHVVEMIVGEGIEEKDWGNRINQSAHVTFSYDKQCPREEWFSLENWFEIFDVDLDFAVLRLGENESKSHLPPGLLQLRFPSPPKGRIFIIGHPNRGIKSMDICLVVSIFDRDKEYREHLQKLECSIDGCASNTEKIIHMYHSKHFKEKRSNPNVVTYNTCFYGGSSGSPVFDNDGRLVALHAAGYAYKMNNKDCSIIEFGYSIHSIVLKIQSKFKCWYDAIIVPVAMEDSSHVDASLRQTEEKMDCS